MKIGILLSGCGVYDGAEIQETVLTMLAIKESGHDYVCISIDKPQHHVINHLNGEVMNESRNMLVEAARIARGEIKNIMETGPAELDALVIPGGFGSAKNFTKWAFSGPDGEILPEVKLFLVNLVNVGKPICALCVSPVVLAKALEGSIFHANLTLGSDKETSPYDIPGFNEGIEKVGATATMKTVREVLVDTKNKIVSAPCYMMDATIVEIRNNIKAAIAETIMLV
ncbi:MAG: isoprenoid biosynthesis glyoxalase ElbB [Crocinitomicaceae bacterium]|nr:isoprenoid biosynthesis glyoxalase ElbB [Crocinitomicaceae bacterium]MBK6951057.1 isoprenoid biosynthesis glyoxalase ElbB [Crocinitomicaceae bacterium]MBK9591887.1 isoprenoid biosynthesis glyoxalase ElbB [Crocinitomicaceae bacterium]